MYFAPPVGDCYYYIVTGVNLAGEGPPENPAQMPARLNDLQCP